MNAIVIVGLIIALGHVLIVELAAAGADPVTVTVDQLGAKGASGATPFGREKECEAVQLTVSPSASIELVASKR
jgi:hypothetical protein